MKESIDLISTEIMTCIDYIDLKSLATLSTLKVLKILIERKADRPVLEPDKNAISTIDKITTVASR
jgi:hypothetical protein